MSPRVSIVTPVYETPASLLRDAIDSVLEQTFPDWELLLVDDHSEAPHVREVLDAAESEDPRIKVLHRTENGGIVAASNDALEVATGEFVAFLDHDDRLHPTALEKVVGAFDRHPDADYVYTDEDKLDDLGLRRHPFHKPDWSPTRFRCQMYTCHLSTFRRSIVEEVGGLRPEFEGSQDYDLVLRVTERARRVVHIPEALYHWRMTETSVAAGDASVKWYAYEAGTRAIQQHLDRVGIPATVSMNEDHPGVYHLHHALTEHPSVSIVIPTRGTWRQVHGASMNLVVNCVRSIVERSTYPNYDIVVVADVDTPLGSIQEMEQLAGDRLKVVPWEGPFHFSRKVNLGALHSTGEYLLFLNDDTEVITPDWIEAMMMHAAEKDVGAVGAKLFFADGRIQHAGVAANVAPSHVYYGFPSDHGGYANVLRLASDYLAVTAACMLTPRAAFDAVGGLSLELPINYNDVDYCVKLRHRGWRVVFTPEARLYHYETSSRPIGEVDTAELDQLHGRWLDYCVHDPFYNPNFVPGQVDYMTPAHLTDGTTLPHRPTAPMFERVDPATVDLDELLRVT